MRMHNRLRKRYLAVLSGKEYSHLVRIVRERMNVEEFLLLLSKHQSVLSPPGKGYDCPRTWQAIAVGSVPLVVNDTMFDQRIHLGAGPEYIPHPDHLSPQNLDQVLSRLSDP